MSINQLYQSQIFTANPNVRLETSHSTFTLFPLLPTEIRHAIWKFTIFPSRIISFETLCTRKGAHIDIPLFSVCHESREIALKAYRAYEPWGAFQGNFTAKDTTEEMIEKYRPGVSSYLRNAPANYAQYWGWYKDFTSPALVDFKNDVVVVDAGFLRSCVGEPCLTSFVNKEPLARVRHIAFLGWEPQDMGTYEMFQFPVPRARDAVYKTFWDVVGYFGAPLVTLIDGPAWEWEHVRLELVEDELIDKVNVHMGWVAETYNDATPRFQRMRVVRA